MASQKRRPLYFFLLAVLLPSTALIVLSSRIVTQERELSANRSTDAQRQRFADVRTLLLAEFERLFNTLLAAPPAERTRHRPPAPAVLSATIEEGALVLPWESDSAAAKARRALNDERFMRRIERGEQQELTLHQLDRAVDTYRGAARHAGANVQQMHARLLLARALSKLGRNDESTALYSALLDSSAEVSDENGVAFAIYAASALADRGEQPQRVLQRLRRDVEERGWFSPPEIYALREIVLSLRRRGHSDEQLRSAVEKRIADIEQALALQRDFPGLAPRAHDRVPVWRTYGRGPWLIGMSSSTSGQPARLVAFDAQQLARRIRVAGGTPVQILFDSREGVLLDEKIDRLRLLLPPRASEEGKHSRLRQVLYAAIALVLSLTFFASYLLVRDAQREFRLAGLRSQFVSSVSHELKTPVTAIRMFAESLRMGRPADAEQRNEYLDTIVDESERLSRLVDRVLDFSKIERGEKRYKMKPTSLPAVVESARRSTEYPLAKSGFRLAIETERHIPPVLADADALEQAILNLLSNAMKYSGAHNEIDLRLRMVDGFAAIEIQDRGFGIAPEEQKRIFESFYRSPTPENQEVSGTGLGLSVVAHVAHAHGGHVEVRSARGEGSTFALYIPVEVNA